MQKLRLSVLSAVPESLSAPTDEYPPQIHGCRAACQIPQLRQRGIITGTFIGLECDADLW